MVTGKQLGATRITARSVGVHPRTGEKVIFAEDSVDLQVMQMTGIKLMAPLTKFRVGGTVPVWVAAIPEQISPLILASLEDQSIDYNWYFRDNDVATMVAIFSTVGRFTYKSIYSFFNKLFCSGVVYKNSDKVIIRVTGLQPGKTKLNINVTLTKSAKANRPPLVFQASIDLEVFDPIVLTHPAGVSGKSLLMAQYSSLQLQTNLDGMSNIEYR